MPATKVRSADAAAHEATPMLDGLHDLRHSSRPSMARSPLPDASVRYRFVVASLISRAYRTASALLRADILSCLLRPLGLLSLVAVASGAFARLLQHDGAPRHGE